MKRALAMVLVALAPEACTPASGHRADASAPSPATADAWALDATVERGSAAEDRAEGGSDGSGETPRTMYPGAVALALSDTLQVGDFFLAGPANAVATTPV